MRKLAICQLKSILLLVSLAVFFQNCSVGFDAAISDLTQSESSKDLNSNDPAESKVLFEGNISELQSLAVPLDGSGPVEFPDSLPKGFLYDADSRHLKWIPKRGQSGDYQFQIHEGGKPKGLVRLKVTPVSDDQLKLGGPPFQYRDGDIGYIFVHGAGNLDRCSNPVDLANYWGAGPATVAPEITTRTIVCYDSRAAVANVAKGVANQILAANCGRFNRCVIFTHSMGGLLMEHIMLHVRAAQASDPEPQMFLNRELYQAVHDRTLFVVSIASAAGGSKAASLVNSQGNFAFPQEVLAAFSRIFGANDDATKNLTVDYASNVVAPFQEDPGVPFFMIPGFSEKTVAEESGILGGIFNVTLNRVPPIVFNTDLSMATIDSVVLYQSRSDGLIDFRSGCGVASDRTDEGPGRSATLEQHFRYCWDAPKKPNHFVWFLSNMNHVIIQKVASICRDPNVPCVSLFPDPATKSFTMQRQYTGYTAMEVARQKLSKSDSLAAQF